MLSMRFGTALSSVGLPCCRHWVRRTRCVPFRALQCQARDVSITPASSCDCSPPLSSKRALVPQRGSQACSSAQQGQPTTVMELNNGQEGMACKRGTLRTMFVVWRPRVWLPAGDIVTDNDRDLFAKTIPHTTCKGLHWLQVHSHVSERLAGSSQARLLVPALRCAQVAEERPQAAVRTTIPSSTSSLSSCAASSTMFMN